MTVAPLVLVVEDDPLVRGSLEALFKSAGLATSAFASGAEFLTQTLSDAVCCLVVDVRLPHGSGFDLQADLTARGEEIPIVFMTGYGDVPMSVRAMKAGAVDFLLKPFRDQDMLDAVSSALERDRTRRHSSSRKDVLHGRYDSLTRREREVFSMVVDGLMNKQIAGKLGVSEITVKLHRGNLMRKMEVRTLAHLVRIAEELGRFEAVPSKPVPLVKP